MSRLRLAVALVVSTSALVACGGGSASSPKSSSASSESSTDSATGATIVGDDFTFNAPDDWKENDGSAMPSVNFLALAVDADDDDGFSDNVNVVSDPTLTQVDGVDELGKAVEKVLDRISEDVELGDPARIDGEDAAVASATFTGGGLEYRTVQYAVTHADNGYVITFSFSAERPRTEQREIADSVMASWSWAS